MLSNKTPLEKLSLYKDLSNKDAERIYGGVIKPVQTSNRVSRGRGFINVDLRAVLLNPEAFDGSWGSCTGQFEDFNGDLTITCTGLVGPEGPVADNPDIVLLKA